MSTQGRSPLKAVARTVVAGAAMIPASALVEGCSHQNNNTANNSNNTPTMVPGAADAGAADPVPPPIIVRPRTPDAGVAQMPTRGFKGAIRARG